MKKADFTPRLQWLLVLLTAFASYPLVGFLLVFVIMNPEYHAQPGNPVLMDVLIFVTYWYGLVMGIFVGRKAKARKLLHALLAAVVLVILLHFFGPRSLFRQTAPPWRNIHIFLPLAAALGALATLPGRGKAAAGQPAGAAPGQAGAPSTEPQAVAVDKGYIDRAGGRLIRDVILCYGSFITLICLVALGGREAPTGVAVSGSLLATAWIFFKFSVVFRIRFLGAAIQKSPLGITLYQLGSLLVPLGTVFFPIRLVRQAYRALDAGTVAAIPAPERAVSRRLSWLVPTLVVVLFGAASLPGFVDVRRDADAKRRYDQGVALEGRGLLDEAMEEYKSAIQVLPNHINSHLGLGKALLRKGLLDEAVAVYRHLVEQRPYLAAAHLGLGTALSEKGQLEEAVEELRTALRLERNDPDTHYNLGLLLHQQGQVDEAIAAWKDSARLNPNETDVHYNLAMALREVDRLEEAVGEFREAIRLKPDFASAHVNLALTLYRLERVDEAILEFERFSQVASPEDTERLETNRKILEELRKTQAPAAPSPQPPGQSAPPAVSERAASTPESGLTAVVYLRDGRQLEGRVLEKRADGILLETREGTRLHLKEEEISGWMES
ncbi:MAG: tetratricopeptide repeat protein [Candidatus Omnitrophica bacterium]|nr:tetratricopeptide repeat protein [Candidatus Omnitrophota bacterium]